jgi:parvulin-like peptidyl-prolyl isomerase
MAKKKAPVAKPARPMTKREISRWQRERRIRRILYLSIGAIGLISLLALLGGWYYDRALYPAQTIARVNGEAIHRSDYWAYRRLQTINQWFGILYQIQQSDNPTTTRALQQSSYDTLLTLARVRSEPVNDAVVRSLIDDVLLRQGAAGMGIQVEEAEVERWLAQQRVPASPTPTSTLSVTQTVPTPTPDLQALGDQLAREYALLARSAKDAAAPLDFSLESYRAMVLANARTSYLREQVRARLREKVPTTAEQWHAAHILIADRRERAEAARRALETRPFPAVVAEYSDDARTRDRAGDLGWVTRGAPTFTLALQEAALALTETGRVSPVISDTAGYHILQLVEPPDPAGSKAHVRHILFPRDGRALAEFMRSLLESGTDFQQVARELSADSQTAAQGGDMGFVDTTALSPTLAAAAAALTQTNRLSPVIEDAQGYHLLQWVARDASTGKVHLRHILIDSPLGVAERLRRQIVAGLKDFTQAVVDYSTDRATAELAGDLGWVSLADLSPQMQQAVQAITLTGGITPVFTDTAGYHVVQVLERDPSGSRLHLREVLVKTAADLAEWIRTYVVTGDPERLGARFLEMALKYSDDPGSKSQGGDLGWFGRGRMVPDFENAVTALKPGEVGVTKTQFGYHVIWLQEYDPAHALDAEDIEAEVTKAYNEWLQKLRDAAQIERFPPPTATPTPLPTATPALTPAWTPTANP